MLIFSAMLKITLLSKKLKEICKIFLFASSVDCLAILVYERTIKQQNIIV